MSKPAALHTAISDLLNAVLKGAAASNAHNAHEQKTPSAPAAGAGAACAAGDCAKAASTYDTIESFLKAMYDEIGAQKPVLVSCEDIRKNGGFCLKPGHHVGPRSGIVSDQNKSDCPAMTKAPLKSAPVVSKTKTPAKQVPTDSTCKSSVESKGHTDTKTPLLKAAAVLTQQYNAAAMLSEQYALHAVGKKASFVDTLLRITAGGLPDGDPMKKEIDEYFVRQEIDNDGDSDSMPDLENVVAYPSRSCAHRVRTFHRVEGRRLVTVCYDYNPGNDEVKYGACIFRAPDGCFDVNLYNKKLRAQNRAHAMLRLTRAPVIVSYNEDVLQHEIHEYIEFHRNKDLSDRQVRRREKLKNKGQQYTADPYWNVFFRKLEHQLREQLLSRGVSSM